MVEKSEERREDFQVVKIDGTMSANPCPFDKANNQILDSLDYCILDVAN